MSKDPAVLFYTSDFLSGTTFFTDEQTGQYIRLLCHQHQLGHIPFGHMTSHIIGQDSPVWTKFVKDENGLYYNIRMDEEKEKRINYCKSRRNNISGKNQYSNSSGHKTKHMTSHMDNRNEDGNEDGNINILLSNNKIKKQKKFKPPTLEQVIAYCREINSETDPKTFFYNYESQGWIKANGQPVLNWKSTIRTWDTRNTKKKTASDLLMEDKND